MPIRKILLVLVLVLVGAVAWFPGVNAGAERAAEDGLKRSLTTFGVVRAVSSTVAVLGSANAGLFKFGEVLHPAEKLIDHFLDVMLLASASFALQIFLLKICAHWIVSAFLTITILYIAWRLIPPGSGDLRFAKSSLILLLLVRFSMPIASYATQEIYRFALKGSEDKALALVDRAAMPEVGQVEDAADGPSHAWKLPWIGKMKAKAEAFIAGFTAFVKQLAQLIASYILQAVVLPIGFVFLFLFVVRTACERIMSVAIPQSSASLGITR